MKDSEYISTIRSIMRIQYAQHSSQQQVVEKLNGPDINVVNVAVLENMTVLLAHNQSHGEMLVEGGIREEEVFYSANISIRESPLAKGNYIFRMAYRAGSQANPPMVPVDEEGFILKPDEKAEKKFLLTKTAIKEELEDYLKPMLRKRIT